MTSSSLNIRSKKVTEAVIATYVSEFLQINGYEVCSEVPTMGQCVDLVALRDHTVMMVEVKLKDWKRALKQCFAHNHVGDYICIALATASIPNALVEQAIPYGYGVIHYSGRDASCKWVLEPQKNSKVWPPQQRQLLNYIEEITHGG